ncbi:MAG: hypothetical protein ACE5EL_03355 [Anaerolineae bacterium]
MKAESGSGPSLAWRRVRRRGMAVAAPVLCLASTVAVAAFPDLPAPGYPALVAAWSSGLALGALALAPAGWAGRARASLGRSTSALVDAGALFAVALAWRIVALNTIPPNLLGDEFSQASEALAFTTGGLTNMFGASYWYGVPHMYMWLGSLAFRALGATPAVWRGFTAVAAAASVPVVYLAVRAQFAPPGATRVQRASGAAERLAILAALLLAFNHLHLLFSRLGSNQGFDSLFVAALLLAIVMGRRTGEGVWWYLAGVVAGLGFYFYFALRGIAALGLAAAVASSPRASTSRLRATALYAVGTALAVAPLLAALAGSDLLAGRATQVVAPLAPDGAALALEMGKRGWIGIISLQARGLRGWYESGAGLLVSRLELILLVLGSAVALRRRGAWLHLWFLGGILGAVALATENAVAGQRITGATVPAAVLMALGADHLSRLAWPRRRSLVAAALVVTVAAANLAHLFLFYIPRRDADTTALRATELAAYLSAQHITRVYFCGGGEMDYLSNAALPFAAPNAEPQQVAPEWLPPSEVPGPQEAIVALPGCTALRRHLDRRPDLSGSILFFRTGVQGRPAARMLLETGGVGYLRYLPASSPPPGYGWQDVFAVYRLRARGP